MSNQDVVFDVEKRVQQYIDLRDALKRLDDRHKNERQPLVDLMEKVGAQLQQFIEANNLQNLKTAAGTCYLSTRYTASLADPDAFMKYVIENSKFELLDRRANATAVQAFIKETTNLPPGCNLNAIQNLGVRRDSGK